jgi:hydroxymethylpyrimidine pyrophosphatase-like HAD family hydrolase
VLYTDLDGTLLDEDSRIPAENLAALERYRRAGGKVGVATGRLPESALPFALAIGANVPLVFANGAIVTTATGELIDMKGLSENEEVQAVCDLMSRGRCAHVHAAFGDPKTGEVELLDGRCEPSPRDDQLVLKMRARLCQDHAQLVEQLVQSARGRYSVVESGQGEYFGVSVAALGVSKGQALGAIANRLGLGLAGLAFVGDSGNDVSAAHAVHQAGGTCFAMPNGTAELLAACPQHTSRDNAHGGVAEVAELLLARARAPQ